MFVKRKVRSPSFAHPTRTSQSGGGVRWLTDPLTESPLFLLGQLFFVEGLRGSYKGLTKIPGKDILTD
jgi:hypothetical protein